jgi:hypothetical protein
MSYAEDPGEWHRLNSSYSIKSDSELLDLRASYDDLTDDAQGILLAELTRRNLRFDNQLIEEPLDDPDSGPVDPAPDENIDGYSEYELLQLGGVVLSECETTEQAELICFALDRATISSATRQRNSSGDLRWPQVLVAILNERGRS